MREYVPSVVEVIRRQETEIWSYTIPYYIKSIGIQDRVSRRVNASAWEVLRSVQFEMDRQE